MIAGLCIFAIGEAYYKFISKKQINKADHLLLLGVCYVFSLIPDFPLGIYYIFHIFSPSVLYDYHSFIHQIISPICLVVLIALIFIRKNKRTPIWILGMICIIVHVIMDLYIHEGGLWI
jgi:hypothetical protein